MDLNSLQKLSNVVLGMIRFFNSILILAGLICVFFGIYRIATSNQRTAEIHREFEVERANASQRGSPTSQSSTLWNREWSTRAENQKIDLEASVGWIAIVVGLVLGSSATYFVTSGWTDSTSNVIGSWLDDGGDGHRRYFK